MRAWRTGLLAVSLLAMSSVTLFWGAKPALAEAAFVEGQTANGGTMHSFSSDRVTVADAISEAMSSCQRQAFNCHVLRQFKTTCFALAYATRGGYGFGFGSNQNSANGEALHRCVASSPYDRCNVVQSFCDTIDEQVHARAEQEEIQAAVQTRYVANWNACRDDDDLEACSQALASANSDRDRQLLTSFRDAILGKRAAENQRRADEELRRKDEEEKLEARRHFSSFVEQCRKFDEGACYSALSSELASAEDRSNLEAWRQTAVAYESNKASCQSGSAAACDLALASAALVPTDQEVLERWRISAPALSRINASLSATGTTLLSYASAIPPISILPLLLLIGAIIFVRYAEREDRAAALRAVASSPPVAQPPLPHAEQAVEAPLPPSQSLVPVNLPTGKDIEPTFPLTSIDTPKALRALKLAWSYLEETGELSFSDADQARTARTTLSLASRQLDAAHAADPNAKLELEDGTLIPQARLRARVLTQEALTWGSENLKRAASIAERATAADPTFAASFSTLGMFHFHNRNRSEAAAALTRALELDPDNIKTQKLLDRTENMGLAEIATYKATKTGVKAINTGIGVYNAGVYTWNVFAICWNIVTFPIRTVGRFVNFISGGK